jgi:hypothetical protein
MNGSEKILGIYRFAREYLRLPAAARREVHRDFLGGLPDEDPGIDKCVGEITGWLCRAQDNSTTVDGGVARHFSLVSGWGSSYPETTGYIVPTVINVARRRNDDALLQRARRMLDWLVSIQFPGGGFQGGMVDQEPRVPVTFNTGQILLGLASGTEEFGDAYREPMRRAAQWLVDTQDPDGCWRSHGTPFAIPGEKSYETHVSWGLFEAARLEPERGYSDAAMANIRWALQYQQVNGWFEKCCLGDPQRPLTHTLGYVLRGLIEAYRFSGDEEILQRSILTADGLLKAIRPDDGFLSGRLDSDWRPSVRWACLTGSVQIAHCWLMLYGITGNERYLEAARAANSYVRRTIKTEGPEEVRGGVKGAFPVYGNYGKYEYLNWACKFAIDSFLLEKELTEGSSDVGAS